MIENSHVLCPHTPLHWGWIDADSDGFPDLLMPGTMQLADRATSPGADFEITGRNVWDTRAVFFDSTVSAIC
jgi:hypothetical protein